MPQSGYIFVSRGLVPRSGSYPRYSRYSHRCPEGISASTSGMHVLRRDPRRGKKSYPHTPREHPLRGNPVAAVCAAWAGHPDADAAGRVPTDKHLYTTLLSCAPDESPVLL